MTFDELPQEVSELKKMMSQVLTLLGSENRKTDKDTDGDITFNVVELSEYMRCTPQTVYRLRREGKIKFHQFGKLIWFVKSEILESSLVDLSKYRKGKIVSNGVSRSGLSTEGLEFKPKLN